MRIYLSNKDFNRYLHLLPALTDLVAIYQIGIVMEKQQFLKEIFLGGFNQEKEGGRTGMLNPMFEVNLSKIYHLLKA